MPVNAIPAATTLTYRMQPHERACFHTNAKKQGEKLAFYFAVQSGGSFDIDYEVRDPKNNEVMKGHKERQGDFVFAAQEVGEYSFCFSNGMSTFAEKVVDFDITAENEQTEPLQPITSKASGKEAATKEMKPLEDGINKLADSLGGIVRQQKYFRTRENRNFDTVQSTTRRIFWFGAIEAFLLVAIGFLQVYIIEMLFNKSSKMRV
ncbi:emp24/gp25L/p24 family/GOLD-domain-containing protein [Gaertneriomyces semiglobifer]|nr:emp24/gp25L/p24 family/GOLD-domain-containing protein [Gaertneriomyces semiglobifer]